MACLGDPSRFRLVAALADGPRCVSDLAIEVALSQSCTTRHLQVLARHGIARGRRDGKRVLFALCTERATIRVLLRWALSAGRIERAPARRQRIEPLIAAGTGDAVEVSDLSPSSRVSPGAEDAGDHGADEQRNGDDRGGADLHRDAADREDRYDDDLPRPRPAYEELEDFLL